MRALAFAPLILACSCSLFAKGSVFPGDLQKIEDCVAAQAITNGNTDVASVIFNCAPNAEQAVIDAIQILIDGGKVTPAQATSLRAKLGEYRTAHAR